MSGVEKEVVMISDVSTIKFLKTNVVTMISEFESTVYSFWSRYCLVVEKTCLKIGGYRNTAIPRLTSDPANEFFG